MFSQLGIFLCLGVEIYFMDLETLLSQAETLNDEKKYVEVISLLNDEILDQYKSADLHAEKAKAYSRLDMFDECDIEAEKALNINPRNAKANHYKGNVISQSKAFERAEEFYKKAIEYDSEFYISYTSLGNIEASRGNYDKAIEYYKVGIKGKDADYAYAGLGSLYVDRQEYEEAIKNLDQAILFNPEYAHAYNILGIAYDELNNYAKALENYSLAIEKDPKFDSPLYNRAQLYEKNEKYPEALEDYENYLKITTKTDHFVSQAKANIKKLKEIKDLPDFAKLNDLVKQIKKILIFEEECITHYTSFFVAKLLIFQDSLFRLSEGTYLNDTSEGRELLDYLPIDKEKKAGNKMVNEVFAQRPFIGSFVPPDRHNDLALWRMYGKEEKEEAKGCAITLKRKKLIELLKQNFAANKAGNFQKLDDQFNFYRVAYKDGDDRFIIPNANDKEDELNKCMEDLKKIVHKFNATPNNEADMKNVRQSLYEITYLFKSSEYIYENELRLIVPGLGLEKKIETENNLLKVYIELIPITSIIDQVTFGPKVQKSEEWAAAFYYKLEEKGNPVNINISHLPFK